MEDLPRGANFRRAKTLWELGLNFAGDPATPYGGNRDVCITIGNGSGTEFRPALRMATGSPILADAVAKGSLEMAFVNPSALLTQAYRGVGVFTAPTCVIGERATYCSAFSHGLPGNQYLVMKGMSEVSAKLYQLITG